MAKTGVQKREWLERFSEENSFLTHCFVQCQTNMLPSCREGDFSFAESCGKRVPLLINHQKLLRVKRQTTTVSGKFTLVFLPNLRSPTIIVCEIHVNDECTFKSSENGYTPFNIESGRKPGKPSKGKWQIFPDEFALLKDATTVDEMIDGQDL